jgi:hypothetical protein
MNTRPEQRLAVTLIAALAIACRQRDADVAWEILRLLEEFRGPSGDRTAPPLAGSNG